MANLDTLVNRIDSMLGAERERIEQLQRRQAMDYRERQQRLERYEQVMRRLTTVLTPRLRTLAERFDGSVDVKPARRGHTREMRFEFHSELARIALCFAASPDSDARHVLFEYDLDIVPALMKYDAHQELRQSVEGIDDDVVVDWFDERICDFVATYLSTFHNSYYRRGHEVEDPVAGVVFPRSFAAATLERQGLTYFFISLETRDEFVRKHPEAAAPQRNGHVSQDSSSA
jgi:YHS domain-containing protein